jgi:hypothetical protein
MADSRKLILDGAAQSADESLPAFLSRPAGAPVYHGFPLVEETRTEGWCYGAITEYDNSTAYPDGCDSGDGFVEAPDGSRAGLVWSTGEYPMSEICAPSEGRWGVYAVAFPKPIKNVEDLVDCFRAVLPDLRAAHARVLEDRALQTHGASRRR